MLPDERNYLRVAFASYLSTSPNPSIATCRISATRECACTLSEACSRLLVAMLGRPPCSAMVNS